MNMPDNMILRCVAGSHLYGLNTPSSDMDERGIYLESLEDVLNINGRQNSEVADDKQDTKYYSLGKFLKLASECNPNIIELLYLPEDAILQKSPVYDDLIEHRDWFMSKRAMHTFKGYAYAQIQRAKGLNKKGNSIGRYVNEKGIELLRMFLSQPVSGNTRVPDALLNEEMMQRVFGGDFVEYLKKEKVEWDESRAKPHPLCSPSCDYFLRHDKDILAMYPPMPYDFIYWYRSDEHGYPFRQVPFTQWLNQYDASRVEGCSNLYRLYHHGNGFFNVDSFEPKLTSISEKREREDFAGIVRIDTDGYKKAKGEYDSFWKWMANRNEARYTHDWDEDAGIDWKNLMHTMRLLFCARSIAVNGTPIVRFKGEMREHLMDIRNGKVPYDDVLAEANALMNEMDGLFEKSDLPRSSDFNAINKWYALRMRMQYHEGLLHCNGRRP